ncbi:MAG: hypothetical protein M3271_09970 [Actinomycetota bacterium]|nr:hypothetical protein [Actinomycetota bacterium]
MGGQPGGLNELGAAGTRAWDRLVSAELKAARVPPQLLPAPDRRTSETASADWVGHPERVEACLTRAKAHRLLDWRRSGVDAGRMLYQEEYVEWRVVRGPDRRARRIEMTTELAAYWEILAGYEPQKAVEIVSGFAGHAVDPRELYGCSDPDTLDDEQRRAAFRKAMVGNRGGLRPIAPYNGGEKAICCMVQETNTLRGIVRLAAGSARPRAVVDAHSGEERVMSGSEVIAAPDTDFAEDCRNSDPVIVERLVRFASEGRLIALDDPVGVYIVDVAYRQLLQPDGSEVPREWFTFGRGIGPDEAPDKRPRYQRLTFEVPEGAGFTVADVTQRTTGQPIGYGAQIAELVQVAIYFRTSPAAARPPRVELERLPDVKPCRDHPGCKEMRARWKELEGST